MDLPGRQTAEARSPRPVASAPAWRSRCQRGPCPAPSALPGASLGDLWFVADTLPVPVLDPVLDPT